MRIEFIFDADCPNVEAARNYLRQALAHAGSKPGWKEWDRASAESPPHARLYGSPTILVNGRDVGGLPPSDGSESCRIYTGSAGEISGVPPVEMIAAALRAGGHNRSGWRNLFSVVPGVGASLLPVGVCPACWPAYAGLLSALGLGFLLETRYLLPLISTLFGIALFSLGYRARSRRGYRPFALGVLGVSVALGGKFIFLSDTALYAGLGILVAASAWNSWPRNATESGSCPACVHGAETATTQDA